MQSASANGVSHLLLQRPEGEERPRGRSSDGCKRGGQNRREALLERRPARYSDRNGRLRRVRVQSSWHSRKLLQL